MSTVYRGAAWRQPLEQAIGLGISAVSFGRQGQQELQTKRWGGASPPGRKAAGEKQRLVLALANDHELVVRGLARMLEGFNDRIVLAEVVAGTHVVGDVDVILYDSFSQPRVDARTISCANETGRDSKVVVYTWNVAPELVEFALAHGAKGYLSKNLCGEDLVSALELIHQGEILVRGEEPSHGDELGRWPGELDGLSLRESELVALVAAGLGNQDIAYQTCVSINTVKSYIRSAYRKMEVTTRSQAVIWAVQHGFASTPVRIHPASGQDLQRLSTQGKASSRR